MLLIFDVDDLLDNPFPILLVPVNDIGRHCRADKTVRGIRVVVEANLEGHEPVFTEVNRVSHPLFLEIPEVDFTAVLEMPDRFQIESRHEGVWRGPLT